MGGVKTMNSTDALNILIDAFGMEGAMTDTAGNLAYEFLGDFDFAAAELADDVIRLSAAFPDVPVDAPATLKRRLLEASVMGVETGFGSMAPDPMGSSAMAMIDTIQLGLLDEDDFKIRMVDFMLHVEYWRSEGLATVMADYQKEAVASSVEETMIRA